MVFLLDGARRTLGGEGMSTGAVPFEVLLGSEEWTGLVVLVVLDIGVTAGELGVDCGL